MKKHVLVAILFFICFSLFSLSSFSQTITADTTLANQYLDLAKKYENNSKFDSALYYVKKAQILFIKYLGGKSIENANVLHLMGRLYWHDGNYDLAMEYYFKALQIRQKLLGEKNPDVAMSYNNIGIVYAEKGEYNKTLEYFFKALQIRKEIFGEKHPDLASSYQNIGNVYDDIGEHDKALEYHNKALQIRKEILGERHPDLASSYHNIGITYYYKGDYKKALENNFKSLQISKEIYGEKHPDVASSYESIGNDYYGKGEYDKALEYFFKSLQIRQEIYGEKHPYVATNYNNIGATYEIKGEYDKALEYHFKSLQIIKEILGEENPNVARSYNNIGNVYYDKGDYDKALEYHFKDLLITKEIFGEKNPDVAEGYNNIGGIYYYKGEYDTALDYYSKSLQIRKETLGEKNPFVAESYNDIGRVYNKKGESDKALDYYQKGVASCLYDFNDTVDVYKAPIIKRFLDWNYLLQSLQLKAQIIADNNKILTGHSFNERKKIALRHYQACDTLIDITRKEITAQSDKLALGERASEVYREANDLLIPFLPAKNAEVMKKISDEDRNLAFYFSEKTKSSVLLEALAGQEAKKYAGIPDSMLQKEYNLSIDLAFYTKKLAEAGQSDTTQIELYRNKLFSINRRYDSLISVFENQFPEYYKLKYENIPATIKDIQNLLDKKTAMISYFTGDTTITIFILTKKNLDVKRVPKITGLNDSIVFYRYGLTLEMPEISRRLGYKLYQQLFSDTAPISGQIENLLIVPDGRLATLPFETLLAKNYKGNINAYNEYPYLIKKYNISYSYSANLFYQTFFKNASSTGKITNLNDWLAFAPIFDNQEEQSIAISGLELQRQLEGLKTDSMMIHRSMFTGNYIRPLPATETETEAIFELYDGNNLKAKVLLHSNANEKSIKSGELEQYKVLHFATHGFINSERPELSGLLLAQDTTGGEDGVLYSGEIYNLKLNADLVVLSACETGLGKIQKGEGIIGLTRALLYAGAKNIIVSLWQVPDKSTSDLMVDFYRNLLAIKGQISYSEALRNAKLRMISEGNNTYPFFWSPFILIGK